MDAYNSSNISLAPDKMVTQVKYNSCDYCTHLYKNKIDASTGTCHRFPLEVEKKETDWCGEFKTNHLWEDEARMNLEKVYSDWTFWK